MENPNKPAGNGPAIEPLKDGGKSIQPEVDILEDSVGLILRVDLPGVAPGLAKVEVDENNILSIRAKAAFPEPKTVLMRQFGIGDYYRAFQLGPAYDRNTIRAELADGILVVTIPKKAEARPRHIEIKA